MKSAGAVTASSIDASAAGERILRAGGNAVDAAVATALASCVADACNTGIGGLGGHLIVAAPGRSPACVDFNAWAPVNAVAAYRRATPIGPLASVIPNVVAGLSRALAEFGTMGWTTVLAPAIALAEEGLICGPTLVRALQDVRGAGFVDECFRFEAEPTKDGKGAVRLRQPLLARTLRQLAAHGPRWFYDGPIAANGSRCLREAGHDIGPGHWIDALDAVTVEEPSSLRLGHAALLSSPLGSSGSICMFATAAAGRALAAHAGLESSDAICQWAERIAAAWSYRFGDPAGNSIAADGIADWIARAAAYKPSSPAAAGGGHTCHLNTADKNGMMVAATLTHGKLWFGARWAVPDTGVIMNYGSPALSDAEPKRVADRARGVTNMNPTLALLDDGARLAIGTPGARRIASIVGIVLTRHLFGRVPLSDAIRRGRFHAEDRSRATLEADRLAPGVEAALRRAFAAVEPENPADYYGPCTAIRRDPNGGMTLGLDDRFPGFGAIVDMPNG